MCKDKFHIVFRLKQLFSVVRFCLSAFKKFYFLRSAGFRITWSGETLCNPKDFSTF